MESEEVLEIKEVSVPEICAICTNPKFIPIFKIIDGRICFVCLDSARFKRHIKLDDLHELTSKEIKQKKITKEDKP